MEKRSAARLFLLTAPELILSEASIPPSSLQYFTTKATTTQLLRDLVRQVRDEDAHDDRLHQRREGLRHVGGHEEVLRRIHERLGLLPQLLTTCTSSATSVGTKKFTQATSRVSLMKISTNICVMQASR